MENHSRSGSLELFFFFFDFSQRIIIRRLEGRERERERGTFSASATFLIDFSIRPGVCRSIASAVQSRRLRYFFSSFFPPFRDCCCQQFLFFLLLFFFSVLMSWALKPTPQLSLVSSCRLKSIYGDFGLNQVKVSKQLKVGEDKTFACVWSRDSSVRAAGVAMVTVVNW